MNLRDHFTLRPVIFERFTRKSQQDVVEIVDAVVSGPLDQLEITHAGSVLSHQLENVRRQTLHTRLNREQTAFAHLLELHARQARPHFVVNANVSIRSTQLTEQLIDVLRRDDVVDRVEIEDAVTSRELIELLNDMIHTHRTKLHPRSIQTTKRAVVLDTPPAAARCFYRQQNSLRFITVVITAFLACVEILVEVGRGSLV